MPWRPITADQIKGKFMPSEIATMKLAQGGDVNAALELLTQERLPDSIRAFVGAMNAQGYAVNTDDTIPDQLREFVLARAVWNWLNDFPKLELLRTDARKDAARDAAEALKDITSRDFGAIEAPVTDPPTAAVGNWNSERKLIHRMHALPTPVQQTVAGNYYANPDGPTDEGTSSAPENLIGTNPSMVYDVDPNTEGLVPKYPQSPCTAYSSDGSGSFFGWNVDSQVWQ